MRHRLTSLALVALLKACTPGSASAPSAAPQVAATGSEPSITWFEDAPERAFEAAAALKRLVLADLWAPWCHTCLSMRHEVLNVQRLPALSKLVPLSIDTERAENASFLQTYPVAVWPTFYLIDPGTREVKGRWLGGATPEQLARWLDDAARGGGPADAVRRGDALAAQKRFAEAEAEYRAALSQAPDAWPRRPETLVALISTLLKQKSYAACLELVLAQGPRLTPSVSTVDFLASGATCAERASNSDTTTSARQVIEQSLVQNCESRAPGVSADDQADACGNLREVRQAQGNASGARAASERALEIIGAASQGVGPSAQLIYDWERTASLSHLGRTDEAISLLLERERQLPASYNPPHYLARLYRDTGHVPEALAAIDRAIGKAYGPRRIGFLGLKADLLKRAGRTEEARSLLEQQLAAYRALPAGQKLPEAEAAVEQRLAETSQPPP